MRGPSLFVGAIVAAALPAHAWGQATAEDAAAIGQGIQAWISQNLETPGVRVELSGPIDVTPSGADYRVAFPQTEIVINDGGRIVVDFFDISLTPTSEGFYDATWQMPERYPILSRAGDEEAVITIDKQFGTGVFAPAFDTFITMDFSLDDIVVRPSQEEGQLSIESIAMAVESDDLGGGVYDSDFDMAISNIEFFDGDRSQFDLELLALEGTVEAIDMPAYATFTREFNAIMATVEQGDVPDEAALFTAAADLIARTPKLFDSMDIAYSVQDFFFQEPGERVEIGEGYYQLFVSGLRGDVSSLGMSLSVEEIDVEPAPPQFEYVPQESVISLSLQDLPNDQLLTILTDFLRMSAQTNPDNAVLMAGAQLQQAVMAGGSTLQIEEVVALADIYSLLMEGEVIPRADAAFGVTANAFMQIGGMPELIAALQTEPDGQQAVQGLTVLQGLGQQGTDDEGNAVRIYELDLQANGTVLLNGTDMGPILQGLMQ